MNNKKMVTNFLFRFCFSFIVVCHSPIACSPFFMRIPPSINCDTQHKKLKMVQNEQNMELEELKMRLNETEEQLNIERQNNAIIRKMVAFIAGAQVVTLAAIYYVQKRSQ